MPHFNNDTSRIGIRAQAGTQIQPGMQEIWDSIEEMKKYSSEIKSSKYLTMADKDWESLKTDPQNVSNTILDFLREQQKLYAKWTESFDKIADSLSKQVEETSEIAASSKDLARTAIEKAQKADIKGWVAVGISLIGLAVEIISNWNTIITFF